MLVSTSLHGLVAAALLVITSIGFTNADERTDVIDQAKRKAMYEAMQADFRKNSPFVMLYQQTEVAAYRSDVEGLKLGPTSDTTYMFRVSKK